MIDRLSNPVDPPHVEASTRAVTRAGAQGDGERDRNAEREAARGVDGSPAVVRDLSEAVAAGARPHESGIPSESPDHPDDQRDEVSASEDQGSADDGNSEESPAAPFELTEEEKARLREMRQRDAEVRRHEQAHRIVGGGYVSLPTYEYERGPDGHLYAISGEVEIDTSEEESPEATIAKMEVVIRAALAPAEPSAKDRAAAAEAKRIKAEAEQELRQQKQEEQSGDGESASSPDVGKALDAYSRSAVGLVTDPSEEEEEPTKGSGVLA